MFETTGGGGWGNPLTRSVERVLNDVKDDYISVESARALYGVVIDANAMTVDEAATAKLRQSAVG
ncbi:hypothetical protein [Paraburkholderia sp. J10-1]|uniref:hypothetical protein n=1 Tax=Paraburkholderia sp. J10-1 TaxID=2805430 RepID=UPI002AB7A671|nr:hypothetical protein [Paraburkholderia sp. J10-1]